MIPTAIQAKIKEEKQMTTSGHTTMNNRGKIDED
jgi:hypothetical protein